MFGAIWKDWLNIHDIIMEKSIIRKRVLRTLLSVDVSQATEANQHEPNGQTRKQLHK